MKLMNTYPYFNFFPSLKRKCEKTIFLLATDGDFSSFFNDANKLYMEDCGYHSAQNEPIKATETTINPKCKEKCSIHDAIIKLKKQGITVLLIYIPQFYLDKASFDQHLGIKRFDEQKNTNEIKNQNAINELERTKEELVRTQGKLERTQGELERTKEELVSTKEELKRTKEELVRTKEELVSTKKELERTKEELVSTKEELVSTKEELKRTKEELVRTQGDIQELKRNMEEAEKRHQYEIDNYKKEFELKIQDILEQLKNKN